jgi:multimeric flavodoxin WrbA
MKRTFLLINGSKYGCEGNTQTLMDEAAERLANYGEVQWLHLTEGVSVEAAENALRAASAIVIGTGTYWDSWGSPLQRFLEDMTHTEGTDCWIGKPVAVLITMHSVGGKAVLSRLQGVLNTFGALIPPMCGIVYSAVAHAALRGEENAITEDLWRQSDLDIICHNLNESCNHANKWRSWPVERQHFSDKWLKR